MSIALGSVATIIAARTYYPRLLYPAPHRDAHAPAEGRLLTAAARDGVRVHATQFLGPEAGPVIVYFHGNRVAMGDVLWMAREFWQRGAGVVLVEYRGYGLSAGSAVSVPSEAGLYEDAEAVLAALAAQGISRNQIALFGDHATWRAYLAGLARSHDPRGWTFQFYLADAETKTAPPVVTTVGCFSYALQESAVVRLHFENADASGQSPLHRTRVQQRRAELVALFDHMKRNLGASVEVAGTSWLYNLEAYRRLFPPHYVSSGKVVQRFRSMPLWGQFVGHRGSHGPPGGHVLCFGT